MSGGEGTSAPTGDTAQDASANPRERCTRYFDELWFCYSPVFQMREYYMYGNLDDCLGHWGRLYDCLKRKTKFKDEARPAPTPSRGIWQLRTPEEARAAWDEEFGHLWREKEAAGEPATGATQGSHNAAGAETKDSPGAIP